MTGQGSLNGNFCGFQIPDLSYKDHVRVLAYNRAQSIGKGEIYLGVDLNLPDSLNPVLDGVFYGDDIDVRVVDGA